MEQTHDDVPEHGNEQVKHQNVGEQNINPEQNRNQPTTRPMRANATWTVVSVTTNVVETEIAEHLVIGPSDELEVHQWINYTPRVADIDTWK